METILITVGVLAALVSLLLLLRGTSQIGALSLTFDKPRGYATTLGPHYSDLAVKAATRIYDGQVLATDEANHAGLVLPFDAAGTFTTPLFMGFADQSCDNSAGAAGAKRVRVRQRGRVLLAAITGADSANDVGKAVYASNDDTFTLTSTNNIQIGEIADYVAGEGFQVEFWAASMV